jgi:hypothetical protein
MLGSKMQLSRKIHDTYSDYVQMTTGIDSEKAVLSSNHWYAISCQNYRTDVPVLMQVHRADLISLWCVKG